MPMSSKFLTESTGEKIVKIGQYLAKIWTKYDSLLFWATLYILNLPSRTLMFNQTINRSKRQRAAA